MSIVLAIILLSNAWLIIVIFGKMSFRLHILCLWSPLYYMQIRMPYASRKVNIAKVLYFLWFCQFVQLPLNCEKAGVVVLSLFNAIVMREKKERCFLPLTQKYSFRFYTSQSMTQDYNNKNIKKFFTSHIPHANIQSFYITKTFMGLLS